MKQGFKLRIFKKKIRYKVIIFIQNTEKVLCHGYKDTFVSFFKDLVCKLPSHKNISFHHSKEVKELAELSNKKIIFSRDNKIIYREIFELDTAFHVKLCIWYAQ